MHIRLVTEIEDLVFPLSLRLEDHGLAPAEPAIKSTKEYALRYRADLSPREIIQVLDAVKPLRPKPVPDPLLRDVDVELHLGDSVPLSKWHVRLNTNSTATAMKAIGELEALGFDDAGLERGFPPRNVLKFGGATTFARDLVRWSVSDQGISLLEEKAWDNDDDDIFLNFRHAPAGEEGIRAHIPVRIVTDDLVKANPLKAALSDSGFGDVSVETVNGKTAKGLRFSLRWGSLTRLNAFAEAADLSDAINRFVSEANVDTDRFPIVCADGGEEDSVRIDLPIGGSAAGTLRPYAGTSPKRYDVLLRCDDDALKVSLKQRLKEMGFFSVRTVSCPKDRLEDGFYVRWNEKEFEGTVHEEVMSLVRGELLTAGVEPENVQEQFGSGLDDGRIEIGLPVAALRDGRLDEIRNDPSRYNIKLIGGSMRVRRALKASIGALGFGSIRTESATPSKQQIDVGGAPDALVSKIQSVIADDLGVRLKKNVRWPVSDHDIWIYLGDIEDLAEPIDPEGTLLETRPVAQELAVMPVVETIIEDRPFITRKNGKLWVGDICLPCRRRSKGPYVPSRSVFDWFCIDQSTADILHHFATSVLMREPTLFVGPTSSSKTSAVMYLGAQLGRPVYRLNLDGMSDSGTLIGRFVPNAREDAEAAENPWRFEWGLLPRGMLDGAIVLLDEINTALPECLERINSALEKPATLVISEYDDALIGPGGRAVHEDFLPVGTMNPPDTDSAGHGGYVGRQVLSPAFIDRWRAYKKVDGPDQADIHANLRLLVYGEQPPVVVAGRSYPGATQKARFPDLDQFEGISEFLSALAQFHVSVNRAASSSEDGEAQLGQRKREKYVFTRRGLISVLEHMDLHLQRTPSTGLRDLAWPAIERYYVQKISNPNEAESVRRLADAVGIGPRQWVVG